MILLSPIELITSNGRLLSSYYPYKAFAIASKFKVPLFYALVLGTLKI